MPLPERNRLATEHAPGLDGVASEDVKFHEFSLVIYVNLHSHCLSATQFAKPLVMTGTLLELENQRKSQCVSMFVDTYFNILLSGTDRYCNHRTKSI